MRKTSLDSANFPTSAGLRLEILNVRLEIKKLLMEAEQQQERLKVAERELNLFLDDYFSRTACVFQNASCEIPASSVLALPAPKPDFRKLYIRLARDLHPDSADDPSPESSLDFSIASEAFREGNAVTLKQIELDRLMRELSSENSGIALIKLKIQKLSLNNLIARIEQRVSQIQASAEYSLMQRARFYRAIGIDLVEEIIAQTSNDAPIMR